MKKTELLKLQPGGSNYDKKTTQTALNISGSSNVAAQAAASMSMSDSHPKDNSFATVAP